MTQAMLTPRVWSKPRDRVHSQRVRGHAPNRIATYHAPRNVRSDGPVCASNTLAVTVVDVRALWRVLLGTQVYPESAGNIKEDVAQRLLARRNRIAGIH